MEHYSKGVYGLSPANKELSCENQRNTYYFAPLVGRYDSPGIVPGLSEIQWDTEIIYYDTGGCRMSDRPGIIPRLLKTQWHMGIL